MADLPALLERLKAATGPDRFWKHVQIGAPDECWPWTASRNEAGYGRFYLSKHEVARAHRVAWFLTHGQWPAEKVICHSCDNPCCCNPRHLWAGTIADNNRDRATKGRSVRADRPYHKTRWARGERHGSAKLKAADIVAIRADKRSHAQVARQYGVSASAIGRVRSGRTWSPAALIAKGAEHG